MPQHALNVRCEAAEQLECPRRLEYGHAGAGHGAAPKLSGGAQQLGFQWEIHDVGHPQFRTQPALRDNASRKFCHADRRRVDQPVGRGHRIGRILRRNGAPCPKACAKRVSEIAGAFAVGVDDSEFANVEREQRMRDRGAGSTCAKLNDAVTAGLGQRAPKTFEEPGPVGCGRNGGPL